MQSLMQKLMTLATAAVISVSAPTAEASTIKHLDLDLKLQKTGYNLLEIHDPSGKLLQKHSFLDSRDNAWGIRPVVDHDYAINQEYSLVATLGVSTPGENQFSNCYLGFRSCTNAFGRINDNSFSMGDGVAQTTGFGDFFLRGGTDVGDEVTLSTFEGPDYYQFFDDGSYASWSSDEHVFSVVSNNLTPIPLPAGLPLLLAGIGGLGLMTRRKRRAA
ncbi:VPLPA-CTERM sorting domain-containing protein [Jannaschia seosinensis]|uniref:VPLPA-CTERM sorting domain-containing protein n=1 Tax=Jannaschia seosinensis TaxID=313367 RepID=UPI0009FA7FDF|nr:VPLPA-CTERM sorting domain-containing protein [Jannaschia seosinensis]